MSALLTDEAVRVVYEALVATDWGTAEEHQDGIEGSKRETRVALEDFLRYHATEGRGHLTNAVREALIASDVIAPGEEPYTGWSLVLAEEVVTALVGPQA